MWSRFWQRTAVLIVLSGCIACGERAPAERGTQRQSDLVRSRARRDVILVTLDTARWDAVGWSGQGKAETPLLDRFAAGGVVFENAHAHAVVTLPAHASILTGLYPYQHGIRDNARFTLRPGLETLASVLKSAGWATAAFVSAFPLDRRFGLTAGFDVYDDDYGGAAVASFRIAERPGNETVERARAWWERNAGGPRFLWVHLFAPHFPYEPAEPFASRYRDMPYYGEVAWTDAQLGPLLQPLLEAGAEPAVVAVTSDHGEALGEHGEQTHGLFAYESALRVPLVLWAPGMLEPARVAGHARHVDLLPTLCDLLGIEPPPGLAGRSLFGGETEDGSYFEALSAYLNRGWAPITGSIERGEKAIDLPIPELYDLRRDPDEENNLAGSRADRLRAILAAVPPEALERVERGRLDEEEVARLRSLGYLAGGVTIPATEQFDASTDPKTLVRFEHEIDRALADWSAGDTARALAGLQQIIGQQPRMGVAYSHLASMYVDLGRLDAAIGTLQAALARGVATEDMRVSLALALARAGQPERAWQVIRSDAESPDPETQSALGRVAAMLGRPAEARARFERALELDPTYPAGWVDLGTLQLDSGDLAAAQASLERALGQDATLAEGWNALGVVRLRQGDEPAAVEAWEMAVSADPRYPDALFNLALAYGRAGKLDRARWALESYVGLVQGADRARALDLLRRLDQAAGG